MDAGWLRQDLPPGHPAFGQLVRCPRCQHLPPRMGASDRQAARAVTERGHADLAGLPPGRVAIGSPMHRQWVKAFDMAIAHLGRRIDERAAQADAAPDEPDLMRRLGVLTHTLGDLEAMRDRYARTGSTGVLPDGAGVVHGADDATAPPPPGFHRSGVPVPTLQGEKVRARVQAEMAANAPMLTGGGA